jgi:uncharacterized membrane protein YeaQ/YmgE (transglycosylase-associated protein family)
MHPVLVIGWMIVGLIAGWLASRAMGGHGYGLGVTMVIGMGGALIGGLLFAILVPGEHRLGFTGSVVVAFVGAVLLIGLIRALPGRSNV